MSSSSAKARLSCTLSEDIVFAEKALGDSLPVPVALVPSSEGAIGLPSIVGALAKQLAVASGRVANGFFTSDEQSLAFGFQASPILAKRNPRLAKMRKAWSCTSGAKARFTWQGIA